MSFSVHPTSHSALVSAFACQQPAPCRSLRSGCGADWVGLLSLGGTTCVLAYKLIMFKPPADNIAGKNKTAMYYFGYNEKGMLSLYVNLIAVSFLRTTSICFTLPVCCHRLT